MVMILIIIHPWNSLHIALRVWLSLSPLHSRSFCLCLLWPWWWAFSAHEPAWPFRLAWGRNLTSIMSLENVTWDSSWPCGALLCRSNGCSSVLVVSVGFWFCDILFPLSLFGGFEEEVAGGGGCSVAWFILIAHLTPASVLPQSATPGSTSSSVLGFSQNPQAAP